MIKNPLKSHHKMSDFLLEASAGSRPALKEITENDRPQARPSSAPKKLLSADQAKDTIQVGDIRIEGIENQIKEEVVYPSTIILSKGEEAHIEAHLGKHNELPGLKSISPLIVLPDIINVQPVVVEEDLERTRISIPANDTCSLQIQSKGNSTLTVPSIACDAVSSDEELFAECETYSDLQMPFEEGFNRSVHWNTVLSNVTSSNLESLENIEHTGEQGVPDASLCLELHQELVNEHEDEVRGEHNNNTQSSVGPNSQIQETSGDAKNESAHSPDSTLRHNTSELVKSVDLDRTVDLKTICKDVISLCCDNQSVDANISSSVSQPISPNKDCGDCDIKMKDTENAIKTSSEVKNSIVRQNSSPKVTSTIETESEERGQEETSTVSITPVIISTADKVSGNNQLSGHFDLPNETLKLEHLKDDVSSCKLKLESTLSTNQLSTTFEAGENAGYLNQTIELAATSPDKIHVNTCVDQLNMSPQVPDFESNIPLEESPFDISATNIDTTRMLDDTMDIANANTAEPMEVDYINCPPRAECTISPKALGEPQNVFVEELMNRMDVTFKPPSSMPTEKRRSTDFSSEKDFQGHGLILNPSDFDFLLSKGCNSAPVDDRNSVLLRFDPLAGHPVPVNQSQVYNPNLPITEEEEDLNSKKRGSTQLSEITGTKEKLNDSNIVNPEKLLKNVPVKNIKKEPESPPHSEPLIVEELSTLKELKQSNDKMSVDVIQGLNIGNDTKSEENLRQKTENSQEYKVDDMEKKIKNEVLKTEDIEKKLKDAEQREEALLKRITEKDKTIAKMSGVIEAYEKAIAELIAEKEQIIQNYEKQMSEIKSERDLNYKHLTSLESTFTDLHAKYERSKQLTAKLKSSEEDLKQEKKQNLENLRLQEQRYEKMKSHAMQQLEIANNKLESLQKNHSMEVTRLKALLKKEEISRLSVNEQLQQKTRENEELMKICDELINGQGASS